MKTRNLLGKDVYAHVSTVYPVHHHPLWDKAFPVVSDDKTEDCVTVKDAQRTINELADVLRNLVITAVWNGKPYHLNRELLVPEKAIEHARETLQRYGYLGKPSVTETKTYNGWRNYETWNVKLWIDNEEPSYRYWRDVTRETIEAIVDPPRGFTKTEWATIQLSNRLKDEITDNTPDLGASMWADLLGAALSEVDWYEIAQNLIKDAA